MTNNKSILIVGSPGTGKTELISNLIQYKVETNTDYLDNIVVLSKTKSANSVLYNRIKNKLRSIKNLPEISIDYFVDKKIRTIDSFSLEILSMYGYNKKEVSNKIFEIFVENATRPDKNKQIRLEDLIEFCKKKLNLTEINPFNISSKSYYGSRFYRGEEVYIISALGFIEYILFKNNGLRYNYKDVFNYIDRNKNFYIAYRLIKNRAEFREGKFDDVVNRFIDLIQKDEYYTFSYVVYLAMKNNKEKIKYVFVDEANELSPLYAKFILSIGKNVVWSLDPMQTIYNFTGFNDETYNLILDTKPWIMKLVEQRRIPSVIYEHIKEFAFKKIFDNLNSKNIRIFFGNMTHIVYDYVKESRSVIQGGNVKFLYFDNLNEVLNFLLHIDKDVAVLTRRIETKNYFKNYIDETENENKLYIDKKVFEGINNLIEKLKFMLSSPDIKYYLYEFSDFIRKDKYDELESIGEGHISIAIINKVGGIINFINNYLDFDKETKKEIITRLFHKKNVKKEGIYIDTIHNTKGKEFDNVIVINDFSYRTMNKLEKYYPDVYKYELFVNYVGMTRAKKSLVVINIV
ncbi:MAG: UvrD-helicase domain-containing protein [Candidatus Aenigmatarchaeota archaeon]